ncbi:uncharacterized protein LOC123840789 isoform X6 [Mirounga angustirostris]|nr:uncharacterized protein LOC123840789 isoform X3 [Mirounga angustirostris]
MQVAPGTSTSDLTEETLETPGVSIDEDASLATLTGTSGVNENNVPDNCAVWAWLQKSIPDEEDLWIAKPLADSRGHLPLATPNLVIIAVVGSLPSATVSPAWMKTFEVAILNGLDRHIPQEKQLPTGIQVTYFGGLGLKHRGPPSLLKSLRELKLTQTVYSMT